MKFSKSYTYPQYLLYIKEKIESTNIDEELKNTLKLNLSRMKRRYSKYSSENTVQNITSHFDWIVLSEGWCGDSAQNLPIIAKFAELNPSISLRIILRDDNPKIMNQFLTDGTKSIPKLICLHPQTKEVIGSWGPRPKVILTFVQKYKQSHPEFIKKDFLKELHLLYESDNGVSVTKEITSLVKKWSTNFPRKKKYLVI